MKKIRILIMSLVLLLIVSPLATAVEVTMNDLPLELYLEETELPYYLVISAVIKPTEGNSERLQRIQLLINNNVVNELEMNSNFNSMLGNVYNYSFNWKITAYDEYTVKVLATTLVGQIGHEDFDEEFVEVIEIDLPPIVVDRPAAPAIAGKFLKANSISNKYGKNGNYISDVAKLMGKGASFEGVKKSDYIEYKEAVKEYLELRLDKILSDY